MTWPPPRWSAATLIGILASAIVAVVSVAVPGGYFLARERFETGTIRTIAAARAHLATQRISANPALWRYEEHRLGMYIERGPLSGDESDRRAILDENGNVLVETGSAADIPGPVLRATAPLYDAGVVVGQFVVERSIRGALWETAFLAAICLATGAAIVTVFRYLPLQALRVAEADLRHRAFHDALTGLPNRVRLMRRLERAVERSGRTGSRFAVLYVDVDHFKSVNDTLGHAAGDAVLREVADRLRAGVRPGDVVSRLSGDEFAVIVRGIDDDAQARAVADALVERFAKPFPVEGREYNLTCCVGIAFHPRDGEDGERLLAHADIAMLHAKRAGRNAHLAYSREMQESASHRLRLENDLRQALALGQFQLHYQALYDLHAQRLRGAEVLLRWRHPDRGLVPPAEFVGVLEDLGLIHEVGEWVLREACRQTVKWNDAGLGPLCVAVNVSPAQFARGTHYLESVRRALAETGLPPARLELEVTEGLLVKDTEHGLALLHDLRALGVSLAIDDFGTGYSSLAYLRTFPVSTLKVDRSFIRELGHASEDDNIVRAIVQLGHNLGLAVTAEGVETRGQLAFLTAIGCDIAQGFLLGVPMEAHDFSARAVGAQERMAIEG